MPVYFIQSQSIRNHQIALTGDLAHHLRDVLRCRPGEIIALVDEKQVRYRAELDQVTKQKLVAKILQRGESETQPNRSVTLAQAVLKGPKMDQVIQKATELGMNILIPVVTERTIARPRAERESHQRDRWEKIARAASQQCGRTDIPAVLSVISLDELLKNSPSSSLKLALWEQESERSLKSSLTGLKPGDSITVLIGPEGGFSPSEIEKVRKAGWTSVSLGRRILRAETAGMAVLAVLQYEQTELR